MLLLLFRNENVPELLLEMIPSEQVVDAVNVVVALPCSPEVYAGVGRMRK